MNRKLMDQNLFLLLKADLIRLRHRSWSLSGVESLIFEFEALEYISSAGLRVLLSSQKQMNKQGEMVIRNVRPEIMEIFDVTGFSDILTIE